MLDGDDLIFSAASGIAEPHLGDRLRIESSLSGRAIRTGDVLRTENAEIDPYVDRQAARKMGVKSVVVAPLRHQSEVIGALAVVSSLANAFGDLEVYTLQLMAGMVAAMLRHAADFEAKTASEQRYRLLFERNVAGAFRTTLDGKVIDCNDSLARILGYASKEDLTKRRSWDFYPHPSDRQNYLEKLRKSRSLTNSKLRLKKKDGEIIDAVVNVNLIPGPDGETFVLGTLLEAREGSPRKAARARSRRSARPNRQA